MHERIILIISQLIILAMSHRSMVSNFKGNYLINVVLMQHRHLIKKADLLIIIADL